MEKYEFLSRTGEGAYGSVWKARDKNIGVLVAVKKMKDVPASEEEGEIAMREVRVLQLAKHVNIVNLMEAYKSQSGRLYLVFEYVDRTLLQELKSNRCGLPVPVIKSVTWQLLQALGFLHRKKIIHRDVKPSNILITESGVVKICDFGFARPCSNTAVDPAYTSYVVTRWYRPPEVLVGDTYGPPVDIWALGCIFAEMLLGQPLFPGKNHHDQLWLIMKAVGHMTERQLGLMDADPQFACFRLPSQSEIEPLEQRLSGVGAAALQVLRVCLDPDPKRRASAEELLALPYFNGVTNSLPVSELSAYPDEDMRTQLERVQSQDQSNTEAAAAREALMMSHTTTANTTRLTAPPPPLIMHMHSTSKCHSPAQSASGGAATSPSRHTTLQPPPGAPPPQPPALHPLPSKAATASRLDAGTDCQSQRPPLQHYTTAPPGTMAARSGGGLQPLQPLVGEQSAQNVVPQRSKMVSESSQQSPPRGVKVSGGLLPPPQQQPGTLGGSSSLGGSGCSSGSSSLGPVSGNNSVGPTRSRLGWRVSNDGSIDGGGSGGGGGASAPLHPTVRQLYGGGRQPMGTAAVAAAAADGSRAVQDLLPVATQRPSAQYKRATWNGSGVPARSNGGAASSGGAAANGGGGGVCGGPQVANLSSTVFNTCSTHNLHLSGSSGSSSNIHSNGYETITLHRKAHSLAGNESLPPAASAQGPTRAAAGLGTLQGRSMAPLSMQPGIATSGNGNGGSSSSNLLPSGGAVLLPAAQSSFSSAAATMHRNSISPPPLGYGTLRGINSGTLGPIIPTLPCPPRRLSNDGSGNGGAAPAQQPPCGPLYIPYMAFSQLPRPPPHVVSVSSVAIVHHNSQGGSGCEPNCMGVDSESLEDQLADACTASAGINEGRRASDTVLYATVAVRDPRGRLEKAQHPLLVPGSGSSGGGGGGSSGGGAVGLGSLRARSFGRSGLTGPAACTGLASPDCTAPGPVAANLPPLQVIPQRRISAPEAMALTVLSVGNAAGASSRGTVPAMHHTNMSSGVGGGGGAVQVQHKRHPGSHLHGLSATGYPHLAAYQHFQSTYGSNGYVQGAASTGAFDSADMPAYDVGSHGTMHGILPSLDGGYSGKPVRVSSAGYGPNGAAVAGPRAVVAATSRRPSKSSSMRVYGPDAQCKREDSSKLLLLEAVPEASVL